MEPYFELSTWSPFQGVNFKLTENFAGKAIMCLIWESGQVMDMDMVYLQSLDCTQP